MPSGHISIALRRFPITMLARARRVTSPCGGRIFGQCVKQWCLRARLDYTSFRAGAV